jgi:hypothetical protein
MRCMPVLAFSVLTTPLDYPQLARIYVSGWSGFPMTIMSNSHVLMWKLRGGGMRQLRALTI